MAIKLDLRLKPRKWLSGIESVSVDSLSSVHKDNASKGHFRQSSGISERYLG